MAQKRFLYKWYYADGSYGGVWPNDQIKDEPQFTQQINTPGTTMTVLLSRSPDNRKISYQQLATQDGQPITTQDGQQLIVAQVAENVVGFGSDVDLNYYVDVYVYYGYTDTLIAQDGQSVTTQDGQQILVEAGSPSGRRIFSGFVLDYSVKYGSSDSSTGVTVTLASNGYELSQEVVRDGGAYTGVNKSFSASPESVIASIVNTNPGRMIADATSLTTSGATVNPSFQLNKKLDAIDDTVKQAGNGYWWRGDVADNHVYFQQVTAVAKHRLYLGLHLTNVDIKRTLEGLVNDAWFLGGTPDGGTAQKLKHVVNSTSIATYPRRGLYIKQDQRYKLDASMITYLNAAFARFAQPVYTTVVKISASTYDIEQINIGDMVTFRNFGTFVDSLVLQVVSRSYSPYELTVQLGGILSSPNDIATEIEQKVDTTMLQNVPNAPN